MLEEPQPIQEQPPEALPNKALALLKSRKFWAALIGLALIIIKGFRSDFPLTEDQLTGIVVVLVGYILGTAVEDSGAQRSISAGDSAHPTPPRVG
jgi:hypothetical protein